MHHKKGTHPKADQPLQDILMKKRPAGFFMLLSGTNLEA
jgi:hypothetical protein